MKARGLLFQCGYFLSHRVIDLPTNWLLSACLSKCPSETKYGIRIMDPELVTRTRFTRIATEALDLIAQAHASSLKRLQKQIRIICNSPGVIDSNYFVASKTTCVNLRALDSIRDRESARKLLASYLLFDATYGYLLSHSVLRTRRNRLRFDHVRRRSAQRFMRRLGMSETPWDEKNMVHLGTLGMTSICFTDTVQAVRESSKDS